MKHALGIIVMTGHTIFRHVPTQPWNAAYKEITVLVLYQLQIQLHNITATLANHALINLIAYTGLVMVSDV